MPLLIGEIGWLSLNNSIHEKQPTWFNKVWKDVLKHNADGCIGGVYFEYSDEKYKQSGIDQTQLGVVEVFPAASPEGLSSLEENVFLPDVVSPKRIIYQAVKNGTLGNESINFNTNVFEYFGRLPDRLIVNQTRAPVVVIPRTPPSEMTPSIGVPETATSPRAAPTNTGLDSKVFRSLLTVTWLTMLIWFAN